MRALNRIQKFLFFFAYVRQVFDMAGDVPRGQQALQDVDDLVRRVPVRWCGAVIERDLSADGGGNLFVGEPNEILEHDGQIDRRFLNFKSYRAAIPDAV